MTQKLQPVQDGEVFPDVPLPPTDWSLEESDKLSKSFGPLNPFNPFEPLNPRKRRPVPKRPFEVTMRKTN